MITQDCIQLAQDLSGAGTLSQRFSTAQYIRFVDRAQKLIVRDLKWPESRFVFTTTATVQEYQLQEVIKILRVYLNGQPLERTTIPKLEGRFIEMDDQTGQGGGPGGIIVQNQAPPLAGAQYTPQWTSQVAQGYPVASTLGYPTSNAMPWYPGRRPAYFCRGGNIGLVPAPAAALTLVADVVKQPFTLSSTTDALDLPDIAADAVAWKMIEYMMFSDKDAGGAADQRNYAQSEYGKALAELRSWKRSYDGVGPSGPQPLTYRSFFTRGQNTLGDD